MLEVTVALLEQLGYQVEAVEDAEAALAAIGQRQFDLMISDIVMLRGWRRSVWSSSKPWRGSHPGSTAADG